MKLISMTDFVLDQDTNQPSARRLSQIIGYAEFLKQRLKLDMFVPCDEESNVLIEPIYTITNYGILEGGLLRFKEYKRKYKQAKEKVLFEGFVFTESQKYSYLNRIPLSVSPYGLKNERLQLTKLKEDNKFHTWLQLYTIEDLVQCNLELTENALKQIGI